jgi:HPt (histidine-containing phosphotransfer) domain-containing protein
MEDRVKNILTGAGIDPDSAIERFMGNEGLYFKFLFRFTSDENYRKLCDSIDSGDCKSAFEAAHTLKGVCGNLSLKALEQRIREQVEYLRSGEFEKAKSLMDSVKEEYEKASAAIESVKAYI